MSRSKEALQYTPPQETKEIVKDPGMGAFLQVFEKKRDATGIPRISTMTYFLPGITTEQGEQLIRGIAGVENKDKRSVVYASPSGELMFQAFFGATFDNAMIQRFLNVPAAMLGVDQTERRRQLLGGVLREFHDGLAGKRHKSAQDSEGKEIYAFTYRQKGKCLIGKNVQGKEGKPMSQLAMKGDREHENMLVAQERTIADMEEGVVLAIDKSKSVDLCCRLFFQEKLRQLTVAMRKAVVGMISRFVNAEDLYGYLAAQGICAGCFENRGRCACTAKEGTEEVKPILLREA